MLILVFFLLTGDLLNAISQSKSYAHQGKEVGALIREKELLELLYRISVQRKQSEVLHWLPEKHIKQ